MQHTDSSNNKNMAEHFDTTTTTTTTTITTTTTTITTANTTTTTTTTTNYYYYIFCFQYIHISFVLSKIYKCENRIPPTAAAPPKLFYVHMCDTLTDKKNK